MRSAGCGLATSCEQSGCLKGLLLSGLGAEHVIWSIAFLLTETTPEPSGTTSTHSPKQGIAPIGSLSR